MEIMNSAPQGKIGRLPRPTQEPVNRRLEQGGQGRTMEVMHSPFPACYCLITC